MASGELLFSHCPSGKHIWHLSGEFFEEGKVIGGLDIELRRCSYKLREMTIMAERKDLDSWRLICDRCGHTGMSGCFPSPKKVESVKI